MKMLIVLGFVSILVLTGCSTFIPNPNFTRIKINKDGTSEGETVLVNPSASQLNALTKQEGQRMVLALLAADSISVKESVELIEAIKKFPDDSRVYFYYNAGWRVGGLDYIDAQVEQYGSTGNWR